MPYTLNGIGTWYWGKRNLHITRMTCEFCHSFGDLKSYDTTLYFVLVFVPIVPLGKKRILNECPRCRRHRVVKLSVWESEKVKRIAELTESVRKESGNIGPVREFLQTLVAYQDRQAYATAVPALVQRFRADGDFQTLAGAGYAQFGMLAEAEQQYRAAIAARGGDTSHEWEAMAINLLRQGRAAESVAWLEPVFRDHLEDRSGLLALQVEGFQAKGLHVEALAFLDRCTKDFPALASDKTIAGYRALSERNTATGKAIVSPVLAPPKLPGRDEGKIGLWFRRLIGPAIGVALLSGYLVTSWRAGQQREVYVVNGIGRDYRVRIRGEEIALPRMNQRLIHLPEGEIKIEAIDGGLRAPPQVITLQSSFWTRAFHQPMAVINPDRAAVLARETVHYRTEGQEAPPNTFVLLSGSVSYQLDGIDYPFSTMPQTISMKSGSAVSKVGLTQLTKLGRAELASALLERSGRPVAAAYARALLDSDDTNLEAVAIYAAVGDPKEVLASLRKGLGRRPVEMEWHRIYQNYAERFDSNHDLQAEYAAYAAAAPQDVELAYLAARGMGDSNAGLACYEKLLADPKASPYVANALAFHAMANGQFGRARELIARAIAASPDNETFRGNEVTILLASGAYDELLKANEEAQKQSPTDVALVIAAMELLWKKGDASALKSQAEAFLARRANLAPKLDPAERLALRGVLGAKEQYLGGDFKGAGETLAKLKSNPIPFETEVLTGRYSEAVRRLTRARNGTETEVDPRAQLLLFLLAERAGQRELAEAQLKWAIDILRTGNRQERLAAEALARPSGVTSDQILGTALLPNHKSLVLAALASRRPDDRAKLRSLARKLNFDPAFPGRIVDSLLSGD